MVFFLVDQCELLTVSLGAKAVFLAVFDVITTTLHYAISIGFEFLYRCRRRSDPCLCTFCRRQLFEWCLSEFEGVVSVHLTSITVISLYRVMSR